MVNAQVCDFHGNVVEIENQQTPNIFNSNSTLEYINQVLIIDGEEMVIDNLDESEFINRTELNNYLGCSFPISTDFYSGTTGNIKAFNLDGVANGNNIEKLDYVTFNQYGRDFKFVLINKTYLFEFVNTVSHIIKPATYYKESEILAESHEYIPQTEISGEFTVVKEAEYETVTDQVLVSDGFTELSMIPAQFQIAYHYFYNETSGCANAIVESETVEFIVKEESFTFELIGPEMVTLTELILDTYAYYGPAYYKRESVNLDTLKQIYVKRLEIESMKDNCYNLNFIRCANLLEIKDSTVAVSEIGLVYLPCAAGYKSAGEYCYNEEIEVPASYKQRDYLKLKTPATSNKIDIDAEFNSVLISTVTNKEDLEDSCISVSLDSIQYKKLVVPPYIASQAVLPTYGTINRQLIIEYPEFEAIESHEESETIMIDADENIKKIDHQLNLQTVDLNCMHEAIKKRLIELSFATINDDPYSKEYYQAILEYQQAEKLTIGAIDKNLLESLNISFE